MASREMQTREEKVEWYRQQIELRKANANMPPLGIIPPEAVLPRKEQVDHPAHYKGNKLECIDVIEDFQLGFYLGNAVKYILRSKHKGSRSQDIQKAIWYLERELIHAVIQEEADVEKSMYER